MSVLYLVVPLALLIAACWVAAFAWAVRGGQMDDLDTPQARMLHDDDAPERRERERDSGDAAERKPPA